MPPALRHRRVKPAGAWLAQFPGAGHGFLWQHMDQVAAVVDAFLMSSSTEAAMGMGGARNDPVAGREEL